MKIRICATLLFLLSGFELLSQSPFTTGNIVVVRVGDGSAPLTGATAPVFLEEYTPAGTKVQAIPMPTPNGTNKMLTIPGNNQQIGILALSQNRQYLTLTGFDVPPLTSNSDAQAATNQRVIGLVDYNGIVNTSKGITDAGTGFPHSAVTSDGIDIWCSFGTGFLRYTTLGPGTTSTQIATSATTRVLGIYGVNLYSGSSAGSVSRVGNSGLPKTGGQTLTTLISSTNGGFSQNGYFMADLDPTITGNDVIYLAGENGTLQKYSLSGTNTWTSRGQVGLPTDVYANITGVVSGTTVTLYATREVIDELGNGQPSELVTLVDNTGRTNSISGLVPTLLATSLTNTGFRGVAMAPKPPSVSISAKVFLQGAYSSVLGRHKDVTDIWAQALNTAALNQPYNIPPFNYSGTENVSAGFFKNTTATTDIIDWVLLELRDAATPTTIVASKAAFIREDGMIVDIDGISNPVFNGIDAKNYYINIRHRNHLPVRSAATIFVHGATPVLYDFSTDQSKAFQDASITSNAAMSDLGGGVFGLWAGNANNDIYTSSIGADFSQNDFFHLRDIGLSGNLSTILGPPIGNNPVYNNADLNMDGTVRASGRNAAVNDALFLWNIVLQGNADAVLRQHQ